MTADLVQRFIVGQEEADESVEPSPRPPPPRVPRPRKRTPSIAVDDLEVLVRGAVKGRSLEGAPLSWNQCAALQALVRVVKARVAR